MSYQVLIIPSAQKDLERLPDRDYRAVLNTILALAENPRPSGCTKLRGREAWRVRQGNYRVIYEIDDQGCRVTAIRVGHRRAIYRED